MMYEVQVVGNDELAGRDMVMVEQDDGTVVMLIAGRPAQVWRAMRNWEDSVEPPHLPSMLYAFV